MARVCTRRGQLRTNQRFARRQRALRLWRTDAQFVLALRNALGAAEQLSHESTNLREALSRQKAEFDNFRKRSQREQNRVREAAAEEVLERLLPVVDNFDRAVESAASSPDVAALRDGVEMVRQQLAGILQREGLEKFGNVGDTFNPAEHDALLVEQREDLPDNTIAEVMLPGYKLKDRVVRPAMVKVAKAVNAAGKST